MAELLEIATRVPIPTESKDKKFGFSGNKFLNRAADAEPSPHPEPKRRGRPPAKKNTDSPGEYVAAEKEEVSPLNGNITYKETYDQTNAMLLGSIGQIDMLSSQIQADLAAIRASKTLKKKYDYIGIMAGTATGLMGNKISAIREMNSVIGKCHDLDMKRVKELKLNETEDDDKKIADMYNAMINIPVGAVQGMPFGNVTPMQINSPMGNMGMVGVDVDSEVRMMSGDAGYNSYLQNMTPEQNAMVLENNPHIKPVVIYNQETQDKWFDVMDMTTGQSIPNVPRPADFLLKDMRPDIRAGVARNAQANMDFPMILVGNRAMDEY